MMQKRKKWIKRIILFICIFTIALQGVSIGNLRIGGAMEVKAAGNSLIAFYDFNSNLNNSVSGGVTTSLTQYQNSASLSYGTNSALSDKTYRQWSGAVSPGYGLQMAVRQNISSVYSIAMRFSYTQTTGSYRKIIDYYNFGKDNGFYLLSGKLVFYNSGVKATGVTTFSDNQIIDLIVTRNASNTFTVYSVVNGVFKTEFSYTDSSNEAAGYWNGTNTLFGFFRDEGGGEFSNGGKAYSIKVWDYALTEAEARMAAEPITVTYKQKNGTTIKSASYAPGATVTVDSYTGTDEFRGWLGSDGKTYQPGSTFAIQTATTLTAITVPNSPTWEQEGSYYYVYGNGKPITIRKSGTATAVYWDSDSDGAMDDIIVSFAETVSGYIFVYGGGKSDTMPSRDASVTLESGSVGRIYGCGRESGTTIRNVKIALMGGSVSQVQTYDSSAKVTGTRTIQISGNPVVISGINLSTTSTGRLNITGSLTGAAGTVQLTNPSALTDGTVVAVADQEAYASSLPFQLGTNGIMVSGKQIVIQNHTAVTLQSQGAVTEGTKQVTTTYGSAMPTVSIPVRTGYLFDGYYTEPNAAGTQYYSKTGASLKNWDRAVQTAELYASWNIEEYTISYLNLENAAVSNPDTYNIETNTFTLNQPVREGYDFAGWSGTGITESITKEVTIAKGSSGNRSYTANWSIHESTLQVDLDNGSWPESADSEIKGYTSYTRSYGTELKLPTPVRPGYSFQGWSMISGNNGTMEVVLGGYRYTYGSDTTGVTLKAIWLDATSTQIKDESQFKVEAEQLNDIFHKTDQVKEPDKGVTNEDLAAGAVELELVVTDKDDSANGAAEIKEAARGMTPIFFDVTVKKKITPNGSGVGSTTETTLVELPGSVKLVMDMTGTELEGKSSYQVFRYHNGEVQKLSMGAVDGEFYTVEGNIITIYTKRFSTYAITSGEGTVFLDGKTKQDDLSLDVQGKVVENKVEAVYKVDISWGAMKFEYGTAQTEWNPEQHSYVNATESDMTSKDMGWIESGFEDGNNEILIQNHSNADLLVNYAVAPEQLTGTTLSLHQENRSDSAEAGGQLLSKVPQEEAQASFLQSYLWIAGKPENLEVLKKEQYQRIGTITVTLEAQQGELTPRRQ